MSPTDDKTYERRWLALVLLASTQLLIVLDASIVNVALPSIQDDLGISDENLQWVVSAYVLTFGGFLLLGGRLADLFGRRRLFIGGMVLFAVSSLAGGLAQSEAVLLVARAVQGLGAAIVSPAALSIVTTTFQEGTERNKALGVWGAAAGAGGAVGVLLGGVLTDGLGWEWVLFVNVPLGIAAAALAPALLGESRVEGGRGFDLAGATLVTSGLALLIFTIVRTETEGWGAPVTVLGFAGSIVLLGLFVWRQATATHPLVRLGFFENRTVAFANVTGLMVGGSLFSMFYFISLYLQRVLGYDALEAGLAYLPLAVTIFVSAGIASAVLVERVGVRPVLVTGLLSVTAGLLWFGQVSGDGTYVGDVLFPSLLAAVGLGFSFVPVTLAAVAGVEDREQGLASGLINTSQQVGGALGLAVLSTLAFDRVGSQLAERVPPPEALSSGFGLAFTIGAGIAFAGAVIAFFLVRPPKLAPGEAVPVAA